MNGVIYCRVSSKEQVHGTSLESQEIACREYATRNQLTISKVFVERGESAKFADRTQLLELLEFCRHRENAVQTLLVWKVDRLARNVGDHFNIKASLLKQGVQVVSVTEPIDTNPEGKLLETILAGFAQFDNDLRATRTLQGMRRKIQEGLFPWKPPLGYKTVTQPGTKKTRPDVPDQPLFRLLQRAWQEFATGAYTKTEILRVMTTWGVRTTHGVPLSKQSLDNMFRDTFYAGIIRDPWADKEFPGQHIPLVDSEIFATVQQIIRRRGRSVRHERVRPEFPLKGFARCRECVRYVTGSFSRGRSQYYPYYHCFNRTCTKPASHRIDVLHKEFRSFLVSITPKRNGIERIVQNITAAAQSRAAANQQLGEQRQRELQRLDQQHEQLIQMKIENLLTSEEFMAQKGRIQKRVEELKAGGAHTPIDKRDVVHLIETICEPLLNLHTTWEDTAPAIKLRFQRSILPTGFAVGRIGTAPMSCLFSTLCGSDNTKSHVVHPEGQFWNQFDRELREFARVLRMAQGKDITAGFPLTTDSAA